MLVPVRSYVIAATERSGSSLLSRALAGTGVLGAPEEYLNPDVRAAFSAQWGCGAGLGPYIDAVHAAATTPAGLLGAKVHWDHFVNTRAEAGAGSADPRRYETSSEFIERLFPAPRVIRLVRMDLDAQAVSLLRAADSNVWGVTEDGPPPERTAYDFARLEAYRRLIETGELGWERLIRELGAQTLVVTYEQLAGDYEATVKAVASFIDPGIEVVVPPAVNRRQRDEWSLELIERYRAERLALLGRQGLYRRSTPARRLRRAVASRARSGR